MELPKSWKSWRSQIDPDAPDALTRLAREAFKMRAKRKAKEAEAAAMKCEEDEVKECILNHFNAQQIEGVKTRHGSLKLDEKDVPKVVDKEKFARYIFKHKAWDLLYGKAVEEGCNSRWEEKEVIDGVEKYHKKTVVLTEAK